MKRSRIVGDRKQNIGKKYLYILPFLDCPHIVSQVQHRERENPRSDGSQHTGQNQLNDNSKLQRQQLATTLTEEKESTSLLDNAISDVFIGKFYHGYKRTCTEIFRNLHTFFRRNILFHTNNYVSMNLTINPKERSAIKGADRL